MSATVLTSVLAHGGRTGRYGEFTIVYMHGCTFITTPMEFMQQQNWARARMSCGSASRDRTTFVDRFETVLGRSGSGVATRGNPSVLARIVKAMKASSIFLEEWMVPHESMAMKRPKGWVPAARPAAVPAVAAANDPVPPATNDPVPPAVNLLGAK